MNDIIVNWKLVTRGMPRGNHAANDRSPTIEEIKKLLEYPGRRMKSIVLMMIFSGIRPPFFLRHFKEILDVFLDDASPAFLLPYWTCVSKHYLVLKISALHWNHICGLLF